MDTAALSPHIYSVICSSALTVHINIVKLTLLMTSLYEASFLLLSHNIPMIL